MLPYEPLSNCVQLKRTWLCCSGGWKTPGPPSGSLLCRSQKTHSRHAYCPHSPLAFVKLLPLLFSGAGGPPEARRDPADLRQPGHPVGPLQGPGHFREEEGPAVSGGAAGCESPPTASFLPRLIFSQHLLSVTSRSDQSVP